MGEGGLSGSSAPTTPESMEPAGLCGRCMGVAVPLRVVPSPTGLPSKRGPGLGSFSRADRGIGGDTGFPRGEHRGSRHRFL